MRARHGVGHGVESQTWPFRSAPCLSIRQVRHCAIVRSARLTSRNCMRDARKPVYMWTTQARCPQTHRIKNNKSKRQFDCFGSAAVTPRYVISPTVSPDSRDTSTLHCAISTRIQTAIHKGLESECDPGREPSFNCALPLFLHPSQQRDTAH